MVNEERQERRQKLKVGVFVLIGLVAFLGMIYALGARPACSSRATPFTPSSPRSAVSWRAPPCVWPACRSAGSRACGLPADPGGKVRVDLTIGRQFADRMRKNSVARIETQGLLGDKIMELTVGTVAAAAVKAGDTIDSQESQRYRSRDGPERPGDQERRALAESLRETAQKLNQSRLIEEATATVTSARKVTDQLGRVVAEVERGKGWAHALLYEEPVALRRLNELIASTQACSSAFERGEGAAGVLVSPEATASAKRFVAALDRLSRVVEQPAREDGVLPALLFDPKYRPLSTTCGWSPTTCATSRIAWPAAAAPSARS